MKIDDVDAMMAAKADHPAKLGLAIAGVILRTTANFHSVARSGYKFGPFAQSPEQLAATAVIVALVTVVFLVGGN